MSSRAIMLSIKPQYAQKIFSGIKTVELRKVKPLKLASGSLVLVYVSSPTKSLKGAFTVSSIFEGSIETVWQKTKGLCAVNREEFDNYYLKAKKGVAIFIDQVWLLERPVKLEQLKSNSPNFHPPQSFRYINRDNPLFYKANKLK